MKYILFFLILSFVRLSAQDCVSCHTNITPQIVTDWQLSKHNENDIDCAGCHGDAHRTFKDVAYTIIPTLETCAECHEQQVGQFKNGKHAKAWTAMKAMPTAHWQPMGLIEGMKGCGGCHKIGEKSQLEIEQLKNDGSGFGLASCDACHTRHLFSKKEAQQPQACRTCHMGFDHPQWEMYSSSKHGVRYMLKQNGNLPEQAAAPTCQTCHMHDGDHGVRTAWGFLAVRINGLEPYPGEDEEWWKDRVTILQALGVLDPAGKPTERMEVVKSIDLVRLSADDFDREREKMLIVCSECHSDNFAKAELKKADDLIREGDKLLAQAIRNIAGLYKDGIIDKPDTYAHAFPDLLAFHDAPTPIEQTLFEMYMKHRMRLFQGAFHANPDYSLWYGWSEMVQDLAEIKHEAEKLRIK